MFGTDRQHARVALAPFFSSPGFLVVCSIFVFFFVVRSVILAVARYVMSFLPRQELADIMFRKKVVLFVWRCRFLVLVWGLVTAIKLSR